MIQHPRPHSHYGTASSMQRSLRPQSAASSSMCSSLRPHSENTERRTIIFTRSLFGGINFENIKKRGFWDFYYQLTFKTDNEKLSSLQCLSSEEFSIIRKTITSRDNLISVSQVLPDSYRFSFFSRLGNEKLHSVLKSNDEFDRVSSYIPAENRTEFRSLFGVKHR